MLLSPSVSWKGPAQVLAIRGEKEYSYIDPVQQFAYPTVYYRVQLKQLTGNTLLSRVMVHQLDSDQEPSLLVYPNPVKNKLKIQLPSGMSGNSSIQVLNSLGQPVISTTKLAIGIIPTIELELPESVQPGCYVVRVQNAGKTMTQAILVAR